MVLPTASPVPLAAVAEWCAGLFQAQQSSGGGGGGARLTAADRALLLRKGADTATANGADYEREVGRLLCAAIERGRAAAQGAESASLESVLRSVYALLLCNRRCYGGQTANRQQPSDSRMLFAAFEAGRSAGVGIRIAIRG
eukprot:SAG31_NODE_2634_length_5342_cov_2.253099_5_plen_142_part_00